MILVAAASSPPGLGPLSAVGIFAGIPAGIIAVVVVAVYRSRWKALRGQRRAGIPRSRSGPPPLTEPILGSPGPPVHMSSQRSTPATAGETAAGETAADSADSGTAGAEDSDAAEPTSGETSGQQEARPVADPRAPETDPPRRARPGPDTGM